MFFLVIIPSFPVLSIFFFCFVKVQFYFQKHSLQGFSTSICSCRVLVPQFYFPSFFSYFSLLTRSPEGLQTPGWKQQLYIQKKGNLLAVQAAERDQGRQGEREGREGKKGRKGRGEGEKKRREGRNEGRQAGRH